MYQRILIATDGSELAQHAALHGLALAQALHASVIALYASPPFETPVGFEFVPAPLLPVDVYEDSTRAAAKRNLDWVAAEAKKRDVPCTVKHMRSLAPAEAIVAVAGEQHCDLIVIGSHGYGAARQLLLGSTTSRVLAHCTVPVLVHRDPVRAT